MPERSQEQRRFSLVRGGLVFRFEQRLGLVRENPPEPAARALAGLLVTLIPLVVLAAAQGVLVGSGVTLPLLIDWTIYARFLLAVPMLVTAERVIDTRLSYGVEYLRASGILEGRAREEFERSIRRLEQWRDSVLPDLVLLAAAFVLAWYNNRVFLSLPVSSWRALEPGVESSVTWAGRWLDFVSLPLFNFLVFRWLWRVGAWTLFLAGVARSDLRLVPTHPDGAAGLGLLGVAHTGFGAFLMPLGAVVAARGVQLVQYAGGSIESLRTSLITFLVIGLLLALGPLLVFTPKLLMAKRRGLLEYGKLASDYTRGFDQKWLRGGASSAPILGTPDIQSLADLSNSFQIIQRMRFMPPNRGQLVGLAMGAALPMLPFLAAIVPLKQILKQVLQLVTR